MVRAVGAFLDFCYLVRREVHDPDNLDKMKAALDRFHEHREIFRETRSRPRNGADEFSLPHQHSIKHYIDRIWDFGAPNGLCSSITESKHIKAVKEPWRRSNRFEALGQMLLTNLRLDKIAAARVDFVARGMLVGSCLDAVSSRLGQFITCSPYRPLACQRADISVDFKASRTRPPDMPMHSRLRQCLPH